jgi:hypothetical protein
MMRYRAVLLAALIGAVAAVLPRAGAQEGYPHLVLEILRDPRDRVIGYKVHHEFQKVTYVAMISPASQKDPRCRLDRIDYLDVADTDGPPRYVGRSGASCTLVSFRPEVPLPDPFGSPGDRSGRPSCPTCP